MTRADIAKFLYNKVGGLTKAQAAEYVDLTFDLMKQTLASSEHLMISSFGTFAVKDKKARIGRNPQTGGEIVITARRVVTFNASSILRKAVNTHRPR